MTRSLASISISTWPRVRSTCTRRIDGTVCPATGAGKHTAAHSSNPATALRQRFMNIVIGVYRRTMAILAAFLKRIDYEGITTLGRAQGRTATASKRTARTKPWKQRIRKRWAGMALWGNPPAHWGAQGPADFARDT